MALNLLNNSLRLRQLMGRAARPLLAIRHESVDVKDLPTRSPYEEIRVELDVNSTRDNPMKVTAYGNERTIACVCDDMHFITLKKGPPVKCGCGYWYQLIDAKKFWEQAPS